MVSNGSTFKQLKKQGGKRNPFRDFQKGLDHKTGPLHHTLLIAGERGAPLPSCSMPALFDSPTPAIEQRAVHLDLKGHPPTFERLLSLLDLFAALRYNIVLVEWEDAFPWSIDARFRSETAYSEDEVAAFCAKAASLGIELIPLVQTLGHMETFLLPQEYARLREIPGEPDLLNCLADGARELVLSLLDDVLRLMPSVQRFHIGGDEAWAFGTHPQTKAFIEEQGADALFLHHMEPLLDHLAARNIRPLLWHDMLIHFDDTILTRLASKCDLVVWGYRGHPDQSTSHFNSQYTRRFSELGFTLWAGSAFKGADGPNADLPDLKERRFNAEAWVEVARRHGMTGIITTGWSRYNTSVMQCEALEASLDSLLDQALVFYNGKACHDIAALPDLLDTLSPVEGARFRRTHAAIHALHQSLKWCRTMVQYLGGTRAAGERDHRRFITSRQHHSLTKALNHIEGVAPQIREALHGLTPEVWIEAYLAERLKPLRDEAATLADPSTANLQE